ncbi:MAG: DUF3471 domain-containing protein [Chitinophagia bacterium]|jgi:hypothetical protein|nr:DUF3471 domain-containing protein [Chitinophagia bacterium]
MKKLLLMGVVLLGVFISVQAQDSPLKEYLGKYTFAEGSPVAEVTLTAEDANLIINSAMGSVPLEKKGVDTFYLAAYDALVVFKRDANKAVESLSINVQGMDLIGKKVASEAIAIKEEDFYSQIWADKND